MLPIIEVSELNTEAVKAIRSSKIRHPRVEFAAQEILDTVRLRGDRALFELTARYDNVELGSLQVDNEMVSAAYDRIKNNEPALFEALELAAKRIREFHEKQLAKLDLSGDDIDAEIDQIRSPLRRIGVYVPGGQATYPSTVLMTVIPARVAGVAEVVVVSPPQKNGEISDAVLAACVIAGADEVYRVGGAQAIGALAYGTETIRKVDKIVGPGNLYVTYAKKAVIEDVAIDMLAGPSEVTIVAERGSNPDLVAADLLAQAEHSADAVATLITDSKEFAITVKERIQKFLETSDRKVTIENSLIDSGKIFIVKNIADDLVADIVNMLAPEHLGIYLKNWKDLALKITSAGAIFIGDHSPQAIGDYVAGPSHVLPTAGTGRFASPLSVEDFIKRTSIIHLSKETFDRIGPAAREIARAEGLSAHKYAIDIRLDGAQEE